MQFSLVLPAIVGLSLLPSIPARSILCTSTRNPVYEALVANRTGSFHSNFNTGDAGKRKNGNLFSLAAELTVNNVDNLGRAAFVNELLSFDGPFPDLQLYDVLRLNDGNTASILFYLHAHQTGAFGGVPATGNKVQAANGELFVFDEDALVSRFIGVNQLDLVGLQISGQAPVDEFRNYSLVNNPQTPQAYRDKIKTAAAQFNRNFNLGNSSAIAALAAPDVTVHPGNSNDTTTSGRQALVNLITKYKTALPDLLAHDEYVVGDGHYAAVEFIWQGTRTGPFVATNGTVVPPDGKVYRTRAFRWMEFNREGLVTTLWEVANNNDFLTNVQG